MTKGLITIAKVRQRLEKMVGKSIDYGRLHADRKFGYMLYTLVISEDEGKRQRFFFNLIEDVNDWLDNFEDMRRRRKKGSKFNEKGIRRGIQRRMPF